MQRGSGFGQALFVAFWQSNRFLRAGSRLEKKSAICYDILVSKFCRRNNHERICSEAPEPRNGRREGLRPEKRVYV